MKYEQSKRNIINISTILCLLFTIFYVLPVHAQFNSLTNDLSIEVIPQNPLPESAVTLRATSFSFDVNQATLRWEYGGKTVTTGIGKTTIVVTAPKSGGIATATVSASGFGGDQVSASTTLNPGSVDMLWESLDGYTPPFYKGRALVTPGATFQVVAITPNPQSRGVFNWSLNSTPILSASGIGKQRVVLKNELLNVKENISVDVINQGATVHNSINIALYSPIPVLYKNDAGFIDFSNGTFRDISVKGPGVVLHIEPFFFSVNTSVSNDLVFEKTIGGEILDQDGANEIRLLKPKTKTPVAVFVKVGTKNYGFQNSERLFNILFDE